jgi:hypothetical protein
MLPAIKPIPETQILARLHSGERTKMRENDEINYQHIVAVGIYLDLPWIPIVHWLGWARWFDSFGNTDLCWEPAWPTPAGRGREIPTL